MKDFIPGFEELFADILLYSRTVKGLTQKELAERLGIVQSTISRYEQGIMLPSAVDWMKIARFLDFPMDAPFIGGIDYLKDFGSETNIIKMPTYHINPPLIKVREIMPILLYIKERFGTARYYKAIYDLKLKRQYFSCLDNQLNLSVLFLLLEHFDFFKTTNAINRVAAYNSIPASHGRLSEKYAQTKSEIELLKTYLEQQERYQQILIPSKIKTFDSAIEFDLSLNRSNKELRKYDSSSLKMFEKYYDAKMKKISLFRRTMSSELTKEMVIEKEESILDSSSLSVRYRVRKVCAC